jgi:ribosomal protein S18 acetylase RimI-like enzyme
MAGDSGGGATLAVAKRLTQETYELADRVLAIAPSVIDLLEARGLHRSKLAYCPLWANEMQFRPLPGDERRAEFGVPDSRVVVLYAGAIGSTQDLDSLVDALGLLPPDVAGSLECWIIGDGLGLPELTRRVRGLPPGSPTVRVLGRRPMAEMASWTAAADICYVGLRTDDHARHTLPSKVQTTLAMAKPLLASVAGDVDALVRDLGVGFSSAGSGPRPLADALSEAVLLGRPRLATLGLAARHVYESQFSLTAAADRLEREFDNLVCPTPIRQVPGLTVRPATRADLDMVTQLHLRSFPGFFLSTLGPRFLALFYEDLLANPEAILLVAVADDREGIVGFVGGVLDESGFFASLKQRRARSFIRASVATAARNPKVVPRLWGARRRDRSPNVGQSGPTLLSIGVDPLAQSTGVGTTLLRAFEDVLFDLGTTDYSLTTDAHGNDAAIGFYVSRGLRPVRQFRTPEGREMLEFVGQASHRPSE